MKKPNPQQLSQANRNALVTGKYKEVQKVLFSSGLLVGEISQILKELDKQLGSIPIGTPEVPAEKAEEKK